MRYNGRMRFWSAWKRRVEKKYRIIYKRGPSTLAMFFAGIAIAGWVGTLLLSGYPLVQYAYYRLRPSTSAALSQLLKDTVSEQRPVQAAEPIPPVIEDATIPEKDVSLPEGHYLSIPKIGVDTIIREAPLAEYETALGKGVWRVPDFATPDLPFDSAQGEPMILSAHRFGYLEWSQEYRIRNSFFDLPKLKPGDELEVMWDQRRYRYRVMGVEEGREIANYNYDLILYTCKFLVSPIRIFVYAERI